MALSDGVGVGVTVILGALGGSGVGIATEGFQSVETLIPYALLGTVTASSARLIIRWMLGISSPIERKSKTSSNQGQTKKIVIKKILLITIIVVMWGVFAARGIWQIRFTEIKLNGQAVTVVCT